MKKYICPKAEGCKHECDHKKPHTHADIKGCGNVRCHKKEPEMTTEDWQRIGKGETPKVLDNHACVEVK